jgi:hypothetical protein
MHLIFMFLDSVVQLGSLATVTERIIISNYSNNKICDEHMVDMLLPLNTIDKFLVTRFVDVKMVHYNDPSHLQIYHF